MMTMMMQGLVERFLWKYRGRRADASTLLLLHTHVSHATRLGGSGGGDCGGGGGGGGGGDLSLSLSGRKRRRRQELVRTLRGNGPF